MPTKIMYWMHMVKYYSQNSPSDSEDMGMGVATKNMNAQKYSQNSHSVVLESLPTKNYTLMHMVKYHSQNSHSDCGGLSVANKKVLLNKYYYY